MFDFRYHAISLVAVFLALGIGIVLGVTIGDSLVSQADRGLRDSLREDVVRAREKEQEASAGIEGRDELIDRALPLIVDDRLEKMRVGIIGVGDLPEGLEADVREAVEEAGGRVGAVAVVPVGDELADRARGNPVRAAGELATAIVRGEVRGRDRLERLPDGFSGDGGGLDAVAFYGVPPAASGSDDAEPVESEVIAGLRRGGATVVGVEVSGPEESSQVPFYSDSDLTSVDSVDTPGGRAALVLALDGAEGSFGFKDAADAALPDPLAGIRARR